MPTQTDTLSGWCTSLRLHIGLISVQGLVNDGAFVIDTGKVQIVDVLVALDVLRGSNLTPIDHLSDILFVCVYRRGHYLGDLRIATALNCIDLIRTVGVVVLLTTLRHLLHRVLSTLFCDKSLFGVAHWH